MLSIVVAKMKSYLIKEYMLKSHLFSKRKSVCVINKVHFKVKGLVKLVKECWMNQIP